MEKQKAGVFQSRRGGGKDTIVRWLEPTYGFVAFSTGDMTRRMREKDPDLGPIIAKYQDAGKLIPGDVFIPIVKVAWPEFVISANGRPIALNGSIRDLDQVNAFHPLLLGIQDRYDIVQIFLDPTEEELWRRYNDPKAVEARGPRGDSSRDAFLASLAEFDEKTAPAKDRLEELGIRTVRIPVGYDEPRANVRRQVAAALGLPFDVYASSLG